MKKSLSILAVIFVLSMMLFCFTACSGDTTTDTPTDTPSDDTQATQEESFTIKFSMSHAATEPAVVAAQAFAERVAERSNGTLTVDVYPDNQLGNERDVVEGLQLHTVQMVDPANGVLTNFVQEANIFEMPMLFDNKEHAKAVTENLGPKYYAAACEAAGFKLLGFFDMGTRNILTVDKAINSIDDLKGLKIRTQESPANVAAFNAFGASATPMAYGEVYTALESGVLDGAEAANVNYLSKAFYEVAPNWAMVGWIELLCPVIMDLDFWNGLSENQQTIINEEVKTMIDEEWAAYAAGEDTSLETLKEKGISITTPDKEPFREASKTVWQEFADKYGGIDKIDEILNYPY